LAAPSTLSGVTVPSHAKGRSVLVIGDSNVKHIQKFVTASEKGRVNVISLPGAKIADIKKCIHTFVQDQAEEALVILQVGVNDLPGSGSEVILEGLVDLSKYTKECRGGDGIEVRVCAVPERSDKGPYVQNRAVGINDRLFKACSKVGTHVLEWRPVVLDWNGGLGQDGVHFSPKASPLIGKKVNEFVQAFLGQA
jgi:lysophospholipase L1-like esterase